MIFECTKTKEMINNVVKEMISNYRYGDITLGVILANDDKASEKYVKNKTILADKLGIKTITKVFDKDSNSINVMGQIYKWDTDKNINGILIQSPTFNHIYENIAINAINPKKDVDGLTDENVLKLHLSHFNKNEGIIPCTAMGAKLLIDEYFNNEPIDNKNITIIGRSKLVGHPLAKLLRDYNANVTVLHSKTSIENMKKYFDISDVIVSAVGNKSFNLTEDLFKSNKKVFIVDIGIKINKDGKLNGDCDKKLYDHPTIYLTKTPGGTAQLTLSSLMYNTMVCAYKQHYMNHNILCKNTIL